MSRKTIARIRVGSHLYGLSTPQSDEDYVSVFIPSSADLLGIHKVDQINNSTKSSSEERRNTSEDIDDVAYSLPKFLHLLLQNNPNIVETLFALPENLLICEPEFQELMDNYEKLISEKIVHSFTGYAFAQRKKLVVKKERYTYLEEALDWMNQEFAEWELASGKRKFDEDEAYFLNGKLGHRKGIKGNVQKFQKGHNVNDAYRLIKEEYDNYGWRVKTDTFDKMHYDLKFAYHLIRILSEGIELLETGRLQYPISGKPYEDIMKIRNCGVPFEALLEMYEEYNNKCEKLKENNCLRHHPDMKWADAYLIRTLKKHIMEEE